MDQWFEVQCGKEEILRLNVEVRQLVTGMHDEEAFVVAHAAALLAIDPALTLQIYSHMQWADLDLTPVC
jgi:hypothetical protein